MRTRESTAARRRRAAGIFVTVLATGMFGGCRSVPEPLMPTPVLFRSGAVDPFASLDPALQTPTLPVFYATTRVPEGPVDRPDYGNGSSEILYLGEVLVQCGLPGMTWDTLRAYSTTGDRAGPVPLRSTGVRESASTELGDDPAAPPSPVAPSLRGFAESVDARLAASRRGDLLVYVHGEKVDFPNAAVLTAELDHFTGRELVGVAFAWPSKKEILAYAFGGDEERVRRNAPFLRWLLEFLAGNTSARRIHVVAFGAGGQIVGTALEELRRLHAGEDPAGLRERLRLGTVVVCAGDALVDDLLAWLPSMCDVANGVVVTFTRSATASEFAVLARRSGADAGATPVDVPAAGEATPEPSATAETPGTFDRLEIVDLSETEDVRGYDVGSQHAAYRHPWASSDLLLLLTTSLPAERRGLIPGKVEGVWVFPRDYPERVEEAVRREFPRGW